MHTETNTAQVVSYFHNTSNMISQARMFAQSTKIISLFLFLVLSAASNAYRHNEFVVGTFLDACPVVLVLVPINRVNQSETSSPNKLCNND